MSAIVNYVKNVVVKNKLATNEEFESAVEFLNNNPDLNILKALLKLEIISKDQAVKIKKGFEAFQAKKKKQVREPPASEVNDIPATYQTDDYGEIPMSVVPETAEEVVETVHEEKALPVDEEIKIDAKGLSAFLNAAKKKGASDVHIIAGSKPMMRVDGTLTFMNNEVLTRDKAQELIYSGLTENQIEEFEEKKYIEYCLVLNGTERYRTCVVNQHRGHDGAYRIISDIVPTLEDLGLPPELKKLTQYATGIIFLTGPSGTGKSSTMSALIELINQDREDHIITLEDPIEFVYESKNCHISQRQLKDHTDSFTAALKGALREDPDIIILGEMRDYETASLALSAAETGHLVMTTLHTTSAVKTIERVLDMFPPEKVEQIRSMLSKSLRAVICQKLIPKIDGTGRLPALEIMYNNSAITNLISTDKMITVPSTIQTSKSEGMCMMDTSIKDLLSKGFINQEDALKAASDKKQFQPKKSLRG